MSSASPAPPSTVQSGTAIRCRPWAQLFSATALSLPHSLSESTSPVKRNLLYFWVNYVLILLPILFHPFSLTTFLIIFIAWFFFCFFRLSPYTVSDYTVNSRVVLAVLGVVTLTVVALVLTGVWLDVLLLVLFGGVIVCLHAVLRSTDDLVEDEVEAPV